jgi:phosphatidylglycerophosphate synthase
MTDADPGDAPRDSGLLRSAAYNGLAGLALTFGLAVGLAWALGLTGAFALKALGAYGLVLLVLARFLPLHRSRSRLGPANQVTLLRGVLTALVIALAGEGTGEALAWTAFPLALIVAALDGVDGRLARRLGWASPFGARFDMELDALLVAGLALLLWTLDRAGPWVLAAGAMRYLFVAAGALWPWLRHPLPPSRRRQAVCVVQVLTLALALVLPEPGPGLWRPSGWSSCRTPSPSIPCGSPAGPGPGCLNQVTRPRGRLGPAGAPGSSSPRPCGCSMRP